jgi:putative oxidoreductase
MTMHPTTSRPSTWLAKAWRLGSRLWCRLHSGLTWARAPALLAARWVVASAFFSAGLTKLRDWDTTLALFQDEYHVPLLDPGLAAVLGTGGELVLPVLLLLGLGGRFAALGLSVVNAVAVASLAEIAPAALLQHQLWGALLAIVVLWGPGRWSLDHWWFGAPKTLGMQATATGL